MVSGPQLAYQDVSGWGDGARELSHSGHRTGSGAQDWMEARSDLQETEPGRQGSRLPRISLSGGLGRQCGEVCEVNLCA